MQTNDNPFRTEQIHRVRYRFLEGSWDEIFEKFDELDHYASVVGPRGSGKTTFLDDMGVKLSDRGFDVKRLYLNEMNPSIPKSSLDHLLDNLTENDIILFDGADMMRPVSWKRFEMHTSPAAGVVVTSYSPGLLPTLLECRTTPELVEDIVEEILDTRDHDHDIPELFDKHDGDVRQILRELYDVYAAA